MKYFIQVVYEKYVRVTYIGLFDTAQDAINWYNLKGPLSSDPNEGYEIHMLNDKDAPFYD